MLYQVSLSGVGLGRRRGRQLPITLPPVSLGLESAGPQPAGLTPGWALRAQDLRPEPPLLSREKGAFSLLDPILASQTLLARKASVAPRGPQDPLELGRPERDIPDLMGYSLAFWEDGRIAHSS